MQSTSSLDPSLLATRQRARRIVIVAFAATLALTSVSYPGHFITDDWYMLWLLEGHADGEIERDPVFGLYTFYEGTPDDTQTRKLRGEAPWFANDALRWKLFRPLSSLSLHLDHALYGTWAPGYELTTLLFYLAFLASVLRLLRLLLPEELAAIALLFFSLSVRLFEPAVWAASRHVLISGTFAMLSVAAHVTARREGRFPLASLGLFALGLLGGETAVAVAPLIAAYELMAGEGSRAERARGAAPIVALACAFTLAYRAAGFGASGSSLYTDVLAMPSETLLDLPRRIAITAATQILGLPAAVYLFARALRPYFLLGGVTFGLAFAVVARAAFLRQPQEIRRHVAFLCLGAFVWSLVIPPNGSRAAVVVTVAIASLQALIADAARQTWRDGTERWRRPKLAAASMFVLLAFVLHPVIWVALGRTQRAMSARFESIVNEADLGVRAPDEAIVLLAAPHPYFSQLFLFMREVRGRPMPRSWWPLSFAESALDVRRVDDHTIELTAPDSGFFDSGVVEVFRDVRRPVHAGTEIDVPGAFRARVTAMQGTSVRGVSFRFERALGDPKLRLLVFRDGAFRQVSLVQGRVLHIPRAPNALASPR